MKKVQLIFIMIMAVYCVSHAQSTFEENGILYMEDLSDSSKMAAVVIPKKSPTELVNTLYKGSLEIPAYVEHDLDRYQVIGIASMAFRGDNLEELTIAEGPTMVGDNVFNNTALRRLVYPGSLKKLPGLYSPALEILELGEGITEIDLVMDGGKLKKMWFPKSLEMINKTQLNSIEGELNLGPNIKEINLSFQTPRFSEVSILGNSAKIWGSFLDCEEIKSINLSGVKIIESSFKECPSLVELILGDVDRIVVSFHDLKDLKQLHIPGSCKEIANSFRDIASLEILKIDEGVESIENSFYGAENLRVLYIPSSLSLDLSLRGNKLEEVHLTSPTPTEECPKYIRRPNTDKLKVFVPKEAADDYRMAWGSVVDEGKVEFVEE